MPAALVELGLRGVPDRRLVKRTIQPRRRGTFLDVDLRASCTSGGDRKCDLVTATDVACKQGGDEKIGAVRQDAGGVSILAMDARHPFATDRNGRRG